MRTVSRMCAKQVTGNPLKPGEWLLVSMIEPNENIHEKTTVPRMIRNLGRILASKWPCPILARTTSGRRLYVDLRSRIGQGIWLKGEFDSAVFPPLANELAPGATFLDVGANVGYYSILALDSVGASGNVHAFEIDPRPLLCLKKTVERFSLNQLHVHETAVGGVCGEAILRQDAECGNSYISFSETPGKKVPVTTLDAWNRQQRLTRVDAIKIDVEGMELDVLQGAEELIEQFRPAIVVEADLHHNARNGTTIERLTEWLSSRRYTWSFVPNCWTQTLFAYSE